MESNRPKGTSVLDLTGLAGLTEAEARARLEQECANELPTQKQRSLLAIAFEIVREPMFLMLVAAGTLYLFMGELGDALVLLGISAPISSGARRLALRGGGGGSPGRASGGSNIPVSTRMRCWASSRRQARVCSRSQAVSSRFSCKP